MGLAAARAAFSGKCDPWLSEAKKYLTANRDFLVNYLRKELPEINYTVPQATYLAWLDAAVSRLPQAQVALRSPSAMYSALAPKTQIPPHTGVANFRLVVHVPLIVPPGCGFRVGGELWEWRVGEGCVFDDTIEHEAWNNSDDPRYILICDVWSPRLSPEERAAIAGIIAATDAFNGTTPSAHV